VEYAAQILSKCTTISIGYQAPLEKKNLKDVVVHFLASFTPKDFGYIQYGIPDCTCKGLYMFTHSTSPEKRHHELQEFRKGICEGKDYTQTGMIPCLRVVACILLSKGPAGRRGRLDPGTHTRRSIKFCWLLRVHPGYGFSKRVQARSHPSNRCCKQFQFGYALAGVPTPTQSETAVRSAGMEGKL